MIVACKMTKCPYYDDRGYCAKPTVVSIDEMGMCSVLWRKGQSRQLELPFTEELYPREQVTIVDAETAVDDRQEEETKEEEESRSEDPQNGDAATEDMK